MEGACLRRVSRGAGFEEVFSIGLPGGCGRGGAGRSLPPLGNWTRAVKPPGAGRGRRAGSTSWIWSLLPTGAESEGQRLLKLVREELGELGIENPGTRP